MAAGHSSRAVPPVLQRNTDAPAQGEEASEAKRFAERVKRHQRRHFSKERREFKTLQARLERQRRMRKARMKARQFAVARRHVAEQASRRRPMRESGEAAGHVRRGPNPAGDTREGRNSPEGDY